MRADLLSFLSDEEGVDSVALPVAAMKAMLNVIKRSGSTTMMGLQEELQTAYKSMLVELNDDEAREIYGFR